MTTYRRFRRPRPEINRAVRRYFVYFLLGAAGETVYVGRSCNVAQRIRAHVSDASNPLFEQNLGYSKSWVFDARSVEMVGPFTWDDAVARERLEIEQRQPRGNRDLTARDHRPAVAVRSAARATTSRHRAPSGGLPGALLPPPVGAPGT